MRNPRILLLRWRRYVMSGITRSIPSMPSSGNISPASTTTMSSPISIASMFLPISPTPPSGITRSDAFDLAKERYLLHRLFLRLFGGRRRREEERERREVGVERVEELTGRAHERLALEVLVVARRLAEEEDSRIRAAVTGDRLSRAPMERTRGAGADLVGDEPEVNVVGVLHPG